MTKTRVLVGRDVEVLRETAHGLELAGRLRLRPGQEIELVGGQGSNLGTSARLMTVWSWRIVGAGSTGLTYRGLCQWR